MVFVKAHKVGPAGGTVSDGFIYFKTTEQNVLVWPDTTEWLGSAEGTISDGLIYPDTNEQNVEFW
jgi:hypothetical protein